MYFHQSSNFQNTNGLKNTVTALTAASFPQIFSRMPGHFTVWQPMRAGNEKLDYCHVLSPATAQRDQCHPQAIRTRGNSSRGTQAQARRNEAHGQGLNENWSHDEAWLGVQGGKRRELVRNAACVREKIRRQSWKNSNKQLGNNLRCINIFKTNVIFRVNNCCS